VLVDVLALSFRVLVMMLALMLVSAAAFVVAVVMVVDVVDAGCGGLKLVEAS
jgi:hypothetical protein